MASLAVSGLVSWVRLMLVGGASLWAQASPGPELINPPLGPYIPLTPQDFAGVPSFATNDPVVTTPYFYWYDSFSGAHLRDADGSDALTDHPPTLTGFSYLSQAWHKTQLLDMMAAGIDVVMPVYWGEPSARVPNQPVSAQPWSYAGIPPLIQAREELLTEGRQPPRIGLFYDTSTLQYNAAAKRIDLTTAYGREWFYETVRDYFSLVPARHWAMIQGQPIIFLYASSFAAAHDQTCIDFLKSNFARDFGGRSPFVVREISWNVRSEQVYAWGGALGLKNPGTASLGPGYNDSAVLGRTPLVVPREEGAFFARNWERFLVRPSKLVMIETWDEFHEGTDIANSQEYGRFYLDMNRKYVDLFKAGYVPPRPLGGYTGSSLLSIDLAATNHEAGLTQFEMADGASLVTNYAGMPCRSFAPTANAGLYLYFKVDDSFKWADTMNLLVVVDFFDAARGAFQLQFDGSDPAAPFQGAYSASPQTVALSGSRTWRKANFSLPAARLRNLQNGGADFRLVSSVVGVGVRRVELVHPGLRAEAFQPATGMEMMLYSAPGLSFALQASSNLVDWFELTQLNPVSTSTPCRDLPGSADRHRWYRALAK